MPRLARTVFAGVPHHITQRGNRREDIFFTDDDRQTYLGWLSEYGQQHDVEILAYCLMSNHIHLVAIPKTEMGLHGLLKPLHMRYALCTIFQSTAWLEGPCLARPLLFRPFNDAYLWATIRYVEHSPLRARMVRKAQNYPWSSAAAHCGLRLDTILTTQARWVKQFAQLGDWSAWLAQGDEPNQLAVIRRHVERGLPCGAEKFIRKLEKLAGRDLRYRSQGRPVKG